MWSPELLLKNLFLAEVVGVIFAAVIFRFGLDPRIAGLIAGTVFTCVGIYGIYIAFSERRNRTLTLAIGGVACLHVIGVSLPMIGFRILNWSEPFSNVAVWGLSGPVFHSLSTRLYGLWMTLTAFAWWLERKKDPRGSIFRKESSQPTADESSKD